MRTVQRKAMQELEVKIIEIDHSSIEAKLESLGALRTFEGDVETLFFDFPGSPISTADNLLRLRKKGDKTELTFKRFIENENAKARDECEVTVSDFETMRRILESIGLVANQQMTKHRISYKLKNGVRVDLDKYTGRLAHIPELMEIEADDLTTLRSQIKLFGFKPEDGKPWTTFDLIDHYSGRSMKA
jgi:predicted adenylyl cyclase CyaB